MKCIQSFLSLPPSLGHPWPGRIEEFLLYKKTNQLERLEISVDLIGVQQNKSHRYSVYVSSRDNQLPQIVPKSSKILIKMQAHTALDSLVVIWD